MSQRADFRIDELDCAEEVVLLKQQLESVAGIQQLDFDVLQGRMIVSYDPEAIDSEQIVQRVGNAGMNARPWKSKAPTDDRGFLARNGRVLATSVSGCSLALAFLIHWLSSGSIITALGHDIAATAERVPWLAGVLYGLAIIAGAWFVVPKALTAVRLLRADMNLLMTVAVAGALALGQYLEAATVTFLFAVALLLEHWSMGRARRAISSLMDLAPPTARCMALPKGEEIQDEQILPIEEVPPGAMILVRPTERIPLDGRITEGSSDVNQAPITGESVPVSRSSGDEVFAGTINGGGTLQIEVTRPADDTALARMIHLVQEAGARRAPSEQWVETFARYYTPAVMVLAALVMVSPPLLFAQPWSQWVYRGLVLLVIACPCALVISTPVTIVSALTSAARNGVLIKGGKYLEAAAALKALALDKTGTLTRGRPVVQEIVPLNGHSSAELLQRAAALEAGSTHPLAHAVLRRAAEDNVSWQRAEDCRLLEGRGAEGIYDGRRFWIGSHRLLHEKGVEESAEVHDKALALEDAGHSVIAVGNEEHLCGLISAADELRDGIAETIDRIHKAGVEHVVMLTGDNEGTAKDISAAAGVDEYQAELLPEDKVSQLEKLTAKYGNVGMIGDGVNDAPAMAAASLGVAMGAIGTDAAIETADIALMSDDLTKIPWLIHHARKSRAVVRQNITFALGLKLIFLVLSLAGLATLWMAIAADMGASLLVIFNGMRLLKR